MTALLFRLAIKVNAESNVGQFLHFYYNCRVLRNKLIRANYRYSVLKLSLIVSSVSERVVQKFPRKTNEISKLMIRVETHS